MTMNRESDDNRIIDAFLSESDASASEPLRNVLLELRSIGSGAAPEPCAELQQLFAPRNVTVLNDRRHRRRTVITTIAVVASMGLGASGVAALSPEFRAVAEGAVSRLFTPPAGNELVDTAQRESAILPITDPLKSRTIPENVPDKAAEKVRKNTEVSAPRPETVRRNAVAPGKQVSEAAKAAVPGRSVVPGQSGVRGNSAEVRTVPVLPEAVPAESPARVRTLIPAENTAPAQRQPAPARAAENAQVKPPATDTKPNRPAPDAPAGQKPPAGPKAK